MATLTQFLDKALTLRGDPYVYGAAGPKAFDCSGLVYYAMRAVGDMSVPRTSEAQYQWSQKITAKDLQPGDLIFEQWPGDNAAPGHVVIYVGGGKILQAPQPGQTVQVDKFSPQLVASQGGQIVGYGRPRGLTGKGTAPSAGTAPALSLNAGLASTASPLPGLGFLGNAVSTITGAGQTIGDVATGVSAVANDFTTLVKFTAVLFQPGLWLRVGAFFLGVLFAALGLFTLSKALDIGPHMPSVIPVPV